MLEMVITIIDPNPVWQSSPALPAPRPGTALPELNPASYRELLKVLCDNDEH